MGNMPASGEERVLEERLGHHFGDRGLLEHALTHRSYSQEASGNCPQNERLEFLGDAVLGFVVSQGLMERFPEYSEGQLTKLKAFLVSAAHLIGVAREMNLGESLRLGRGEERSGGRAKKALLVDALEAVIAAVYLDSGLETVRRFVDCHILTAQALEDADANLALDNYKSALQELLQGRKLPAPAYRIVSQSGAPHRRTFTVELRVGTLFSASAKGKTKKAAEQATARQALRFFQKPDESLESERNGSQPPSVE